MYNAEMVMLEKLNPSHCYAAGPSGGLKPFCSCTKVHWTFSKGTHDRSRGHGRPRFFRHHHLHQYELIVSVKQCNGLHSCEKLLQKVAFVWRVDGVTLESEAHQKRIYLKDSLQIRKDWNGTAST